MTGECFTARPVGRGGRTLLEDSKRTKKERVLIYSYAKFEHTPICTSCPKARNYTVTQEKEARLLSRRSGLV